MQQQVSLLPSTSSQLNTGISVANLLRSETPPTGRSIGKSSAILCELLVLLELMCMRGISRNVMYNVTIGESEGIFQSRRTR